MRRWRVLSERLTLLNGIQYETGWLSWCNQAIGLLEAHLNEDR